MITSTVGRAAGAPWSRREALLAGGGALLGLTIVGCGGTQAGGGAQETPVTDFTIVAANLAWDLERIVIPAGRQVVATIVNRDAGIPHNLHVKSPGDPKTELEEGPVTQTMRFSIDDVGDYEFVCDAHTMMVGTISVVDP